MVLKWYQISRFSALEVSNSFSFAIFGPNAPPLFHILLPTIPGLLFLELKRIKVITGKGNLEALLLWWMALYSSDPRQFPPTKPIFCVRCTRSFVHKFMRDCVRLQQIELAIHLLARYSTVPHRKPQLFRLQSTWQLQSKNAFSILSSSLPWTLFKIWKYASHDDVINAMCTKLDFLFHYQADGLMS